MPLDLSVIIPTFRRPGELSEALQSVLFQQQVNLEVIVVDDSPEGSARETVSDVTDTRVRYLRMAEPSCGRPALVRNYGFPHATARYVHFLDDDDRVEPGAYAALVNALDASPQIGVAFGRVEPFGNDVADLLHHQTFFESAARRARLCQRIRSRWIITASLLFGDTLLANSSTIIRRECISQIQGYDPECTLNEDVHFYLRAIRRFGFVYIDRLVAHYRTGAPSLMHDRSGNEPLIESYKHIYERYKAEHGAAEFYMLKILARIGLRWM